MRKGAKITHDIFKELDSNPPVFTRSIFLGMSKAFDKVWHKGLLFKLKTYGVEGNLLNLLSNYLHNRKQRVKYQWQGIWLEAYLFRWTTRLRPWTTFISPIH